MFEDCGEPASEQTISQSVCSTTSCRHVHHSIGRPKVQCLHIREKKTLEIERSGCPMVVVEVWLVSHQLSGCKAKTMCCPCSIGNGVQFGITLSARSQEMAESRWFGYWIRFEEGGIVFAHDKLRRRCMVGITREHRWRLADVRDGA